MYSVIDYSGLYSLIPLILLVVGIKGERIIGSKYYTVKQVNTLFDVLGIILNTVKLRLPGPLIAGHLQLADHFLYTDSPTESR